MWIDPVMAWVINSPFHSLVSKSMLLITVTGRKSGKPITTPTGYLREGNTLWIISQRESKWWRNLRGGATVKVLLDGKSMEGHGSIIEDEHAVAQRLFDNFRMDSSRARFAQVGLDKEGLPVFADCERAAKKMLAVKIELPQS